MEITRKAAKDKQGVGKKLVDTLAHCARYGSHNDYLDILKAAGIADDDPRMPAIASAYYELCRSVRQ